MSMTRSGEVVSSQIGKMGVIAELESNEGEFLETYFEVGWNPEIIAAIKQTGITTNNLKWGF